MNENKEEPAGGNNMRLFIAICLNEEMKTGLEGCMRQLKEQVQAASLTRPENLHLTLAFLGETSRVCAAREAMEGVRDCAPFTLRLAKAGHFGDLWWVGTHKCPHLFELAGRLQEGLRERGFDLPPRTFQPHITLARRVVQDGPVHVQVPAAAMECGAVSLMKSERRVGRLVYTELYRVALEGKKRPRDGAH